MTPERSGTDPNAAPAVARVRACLLLFALSAASCVLGVTPGAAQTVRGRVVQEEGEQGVEGVFVSLVDSAGNRAAGSLSDASGRFALQAPRPGRWRLRAERIGYRSVVSAPFPLGAGQGRLVDLVVPSEAISLPGLEVEGERRCRVDPAHGRRTSVLWDEARKALEVAAWAEDAGVFRYDVRTFERRLGDDLETVRWEREGTSVQTGRSPFRARPAEELARDGYRRGVGETTWYAPDAAVLLSDAFLDTHCFGSVVADGRMGITFEPRSRRGVVDVEGVFWLDAATSELVNLDFRYVIPEAVYRHGRVGGTVRFDRVEGGGWIVREWEIRMPVQAESPAGEPLGLAGIHAVGAEVLDVQAASMRGIGRRPEQDRGVVEGLVWDSVAGGPLAGARVFLFGTNREAVSGADGRFRIDGVRPGAYEVAARHPRLDSLGLGASGARVRVAAGGTASTRLATPSRATRLRTLCADDEDHVPGESVVVAGRAVESVTGEPLPGADVQVRWSRHALTAVGIRESEGGVALEAGPGGRFVACSAPGEERIEVTAAVGEEASGTIARDPARWGDFVEVEVPVVFPGPVRLGGRVRERSSGAPLADARVTLAAGVPGTWTDGLGRFVLDSLRPGRNAVVVTVPGAAPAGAPLALPGHRDLGVELRVDGETGSLEVVPLVAAAERLGGRLARAAGPPDEAVRAAGATAGDAISLLRALRLPGLLVRETLGEGRRSVCVEDAATTLAGHCAMVEVFLDGWRVDDPERLLVEIPAEAVAGVAVVPSLGDVVLDRRGRDVGRPALLLRTLRGGWDVRVPTRRTPPAPGGEG